MRYIGIFGHGPGEPPSGEPEEGSWAIARGLKSIFGWPPSQAAPALPPLTASGLRAQQESSYHAGGVHRLAASPSGQSTANASNIGYRYGTSMVVVALDCNGEE